MAASSSEPWSLTASEMDIDVTLSEAVGGSLAESASRTSTRPMETDTMTDATLARLLEENERLMKELARGSATAEDKLRIARLAKEIRDVTLTKTEVRAKERMERKMNIQLLHTLVRKQELKDLHALVAKAEEVDLAFVCDCTGSMERHIQGVVGQIFNIVDRIRASCPRLKLRLAFVAYRDFGDPDQFEILNFHEVIDNFKNFVQLVRATGGGDTPEDIAGALQHVTRLSWRQTVKILFHIADAPCHGLRYHDFKDDSYPNGNPYGILMEDQVRTLRKMGINYFFGKINHFTDKMIQVVNKELGQPAYIQVTSISDVALLTESIVTSVSKTVSVATASALGTKGKGLTYVPMTGKPTQCLVKEIPNWAILKDSHAKAYTHIAIKDLKELKQMLKVARAQATDGTDLRDLQVKVAPHPFDEGGTRLVRYGHIQTKTGWTTRVFKEFKQPAYNYDIKHYLQQLENTTVARFLAQEYNKVKQPHCLGISFVTAHVLELTEQRKFYGIERFLNEGQYIKYCSNAGFWSPVHFDESIARFCLWTYEVTDHYIMVADLQGVKTAKGFTLTDPVILCNDITRFGCTNLGPTFMQDVAAGARNALKAAGLK